MQIDFALILSAGMGTRMGDIGTMMPKALWPVYSKSLLELQIDYCREIGINKIYINTFFLGETIDAFLQSDEKFKDIIILKEDPLLDSGGAIHNLASRAEINYQGNVLLINADQFLFFDPEQFKEALVMLENARAVLFGIEVDRNSHYNETVLKENRLRSISKASGESNFITYSGNGILKLDGLKKRAGVSKFFDSVADYKRESVLFYTPTNYEYWDFGTLDNYKQSIFKILNVVKNNEHAKMTEFLNKHNALGELSRFVNKSEKSICLDNNGQFKKNALTFKGKYYFN